MIVRSCFLKYMIDRNCNKLGCIGFSVATTNYIKSYGKQSAVPTMSQVLKSFKEKARYTVSLKNTARGSATGLCLMCNA